MPTLSPETEDILDAISTVHGGASILPEDIDHAVSHMISTMESQAVMICAGKSLRDKRMFLLGYAQKAREIDEKKQEG